MMSAPSSCCTAFRRDSSSIELETDSKSSTSFHGSNSWCETKDADFPHESAWIEVVHKKAKQDLRKMKRHQQTLSHHRMRTATAVHTSPQVRTATVVPISSSPTPPIQIYPIALEIIQTAIKSAKSDLILAQVMDAMKSEPDARSLRVAISQVTLPSKSTNRLIGNWKYDKDFPMLNRTSTVQDAHRPTMKSIKKVHFPMNNHSPKKMNTISSKHHSKQVHSCIVHCMSAAEHHDTSYKNKEFLLSNQRPTFKYVKDPHSHQRKFVLNEHYRNNECVHHAYTVTYEPPDGQTDEGQTDPPSDKPIPSFDPNLTQSTLRVTRSTSRLIQSTVQVPTERVDIMTAPSAEDSEQPEEVAIESIGVSFKRNYETDSHDGKQYYYMRQ
jgi:hypothetical protein